MTHSVVSATNFDFESYDAGVSSNTWENAMLFAVHISDGVLDSTFCLFGWLPALLLVAFGCWRISDTEIPRIGVMTAAFFVASQIHLPIAGVSSAHLLLNGLMGVILGRRAIVAIAVGLFLQALLFGHGGLTVLGVNITVYTIPAMAAGFCVRPLRQSRLLHHRFVRFSVATATGAIWLATLVVAMQWVQAILFGDGTLPKSVAEVWLCEPSVLIGVGLAALLFGAAERWIEPNPDYPIGAILGGGTAYATILLNVAALTIGGKEGIRDTAGVVFLANLPVVLVESVAVGFVVAFLARAKPEWLGGPTRV